MTLQRRYSKAKAIAGHVVFTQDQCFYTPFLMTGLVTTDNVAWLRIAGAAVICSGIHVHFRVPPGDQSFQMQLTLADALGNQMSQTTTLLSGIMNGADKAYLPNVKMPSGSLWQMQVAVLSGADQYLPQDMTITYQLRYANGPVRTNMWASGEPLAGIGFYDLNGIFIVS